MGLKLRWHASLAQARLSWRGGQRETNREEARMLLNCNCIEAFLKRGNLPPTYVL